MAKIPDTFSFSDNLQNLGSVFLAMIKVIRKGKKGHGRYCLFKEETKEAQEGNAAWVPAIDTQPWEEVRRSEQSPASR